MISSYKERDLPGLLYLENLRIEKRDDPDPSSGIKKDVARALRSALWKTLSLSHRLSPLSIGCQRGNGEMGQRGQDIDLKMVEEYNQLKPHCALGYRPPAREVILTQEIFLTCSLDSYETG